MLYSIGTFKLHQYCLFYSILVFLLIYLIYPHFTKHLIINYNKLRIDCLKKKKARYGVLQPKKKSVSLFFNLEIIKKWVIAFFFL